MRLVFGLLILIFRLYTSSVYEETTNKPFAKSATVVPYVA
jgi:hypothetical protein